MPEPVRMVKIGGIAQVPMRTIAGATTLGPRYAHLRREMLPEG
jgi:hypothetical protein